MFSFFPILAITLSPANLPVAIITMNIDNPTMTSDWGAFTTSLK
ncbi:MAG: hypothetical protein WDO16_16050 [Bacteroidota bacterium]